MERSILAGLGVVVLSVATSVVVYPDVPANMAMHWDASGTADDYTSKSFGLFLLPVASLLLLGFFAAIPRIDPLGENVERFREYYDGFVLVVLLFLLYVHLLVVAVNLDYVVDVTRVLLPAVGVLLYAAGIVLEHAERNWFVGIRTPWTLSSDAVWDRTHDLGARLFKLSSVIAVFGVFAGENAILFVAVPLAVTAAVTLVYSFYTYRKLESGRDGPGIVE